MLRSVIIRRLIQSCAMISVMCLMFYLSMSHTFGGKIGFNALRMSSSQSILEDADIRQDLNRKLKKDAVFQNTKSPLEAKNDSVEDFMSTRSKINRLRRQTLLERCSNHPNLGKGYVTDNTYHHIYVNDKHRLLYCFIPKVACSNWKRVMMVLNGNTKTIAEMSSHEVHESNGMKRLTAFSPEERKKKLKTYTKFVYVRNPFLRVLSAFNNKFGDVVYYRKGTYFKSFAKQIVKQFRSNATARELETGENITWTEFVKYLTQPKRPFFDDHWEEIYRICSVCKIEYDYIGHLETISEDANYMLKELRLNLTFEFPSKNNSRPTNSTAKFEKAFRDLPNDNLRKMWTIYEKDFYFFDYPKPDFIAELEV